MYLDRACISIYGRARGTSEGDTSGRKIRQEEEEEEEEEEGSVLVKFERDSLNTEDHTRQVYKKGGGFAGM